MSILFNKTPLKGKAISSLLVSIILSTLFLSACGFKPRGSGYESLEGQSILLFSDNPFGRLERSIKQTLAGYSVSLDKAEFEANDALNLQSNSIQINKVSESKIILSVDASGRPAEYETVIEVVVTFYFQQPEAETRVQNQVFSSKRDYRFDKNNTLAHDREFEQLKTEMFEQLGHRIVSQFARQLSTL